MGVTLPSVTYMGKHDVTHGNVTPGNVVPMTSDGLKERWREQTTPRERLIWARNFWQSSHGAVNGTATDAARSMGMKPGTYAGYERAEDSAKHTPLNHQRAIQFGRKYKVSWAWLLTGEGTPFDDQLPESQARVVDAMSTMSPEQQSSIVQLVETFKQRKAG